MNRKNLEKLLTGTTILLVGILGIAGFMVLDLTAESNKVTVDVAKIQSEHKSQISKEVALMTSELRNLQKDMDKILSLIKEIEKKESKNER